MTTDKRVEALVGAVVEHLYEVSNLLCRSAKMAGVKIVVEIPSQHWGWFITELKNEKPDSHCCEMTVHINESLLTFKKSTPMPVIGDNDGR